MFVNCRVIVVFELTLFYIIELKLRNAHLPFTTVILAILSLSVRK